MITSGVGLSTALRPPTVLRVLLIEDDDEDAMLLQETLVAIPWYASVVTWCNTYEGGLVALRTDAYDVVLLDYALGAKTGLELLAAAFGKRVPVPVILLTGAVDHGMDEAATRIGVSYLKEKSELSPVRLERSLRYALERFRVEGELRSTRTRFRALFDGMADHLAILDVDGVILDVNEAWDQFARENAAGAPLDTRGANYLSTCDNVTGPAMVMAHAVAAGIRSVLGKTAAFFELEYPCHSPTVQRWFRVRITLFEDNHTVSALVAHENITARHLSENQLRFQAGLLEIAPQAAVALDRAGNVTYWNAQASRLFGVHVAEILGRPLVDRLISPSVEALRAAIGAAMQAKQAVTTDITMRGHDGIELPIQATITARYSKHRRFEGVLAILVDLSERRRVEQALRDSEERYRLLVELSPDGIIIHEDWRVTFANTTAARLLGTASSNELLGLDPRTFAHAEARELARERERAISAGKELGQVEMRWAGLDGVERTVEVLSRPVAFANRSGILTIFRDATARIQLETELRQSQKLDALGRLAGGIAHDFNNLLGVMMSYTGILLEELPEENPMRADLAEVQMAIERAANLTNQLLAFGRQQPRRPVHVDVREALHASERLARRLIGEDIAITTNLADDPLPVVVDVNHLEQVFLNLAVNARDAMPNGGELTLTASSRHVSAHEATGQNVKPGKYVCVAVSDTGGGIEPEVMQSMFDPFFTTKEVGKGTGLGLATVYAIVNQSGGFLTVKSQLGKGATFTVHLPWIEATADEHTVAAPAEQTVETIHRAVILLVEDEASLRVVTERILRRFGFDVVSAATPAEAIELVRNSAVLFDCLVTDVVMPGMSGPELAEHIRDLCGAIPVLLLSGYARDVLESRGNIDPDTPLLNKPVKPAILARAVDDLLRLGRVTGLT